VCVWCGCWVALNVRACAVQRSRCEQEHCIQERKPEAEIACRARRREMGCVGRDRVGSGMAEMLRDATADVRVRQHWVDAAGACHAWSPRCRVRWSLITIWTAERTRSRDNFQTTTCPVACATWKKSSCHVQTRRRPSEGGGQLDHGGYSREDEARHTSTCAMADHHISILAYCAFSSFVGRRRRRALPRLYEFT